MKKQPIVYIQRPLIKRGEGVAYIAGYVVSKAYLKSKTERYMEDGTIKTNYEVEYIGYDKANEFLAESDFVLANGVWANVTQIYDNALSCDIDAKKSTAKIFKESIQDKGISEVIRLSDKQAQNARLIHWVQKNYFDEKLDAVGKIEEQEQE